MSDFIEIMKKPIQPIQYKDQIWKIYDDDSEELIWENSWRTEYWYDENNPDSEYNKMMELEHKTDFFHKWDELDYWFEHRIVQKNSNGSERNIKYTSLLMEFVNT
jgi:hypothetical protein